MGFAPYYEHSGITIYHGDCREILPTLGPMDLVLTDPPYPDQHASEYKYSPDLLDVLPDCRSLIFWSPVAHFPLTYTAVHIWDKVRGCGSHGYERIFERFGDAACRVYRQLSINSIVAAQIMSDQYTAHPSQKPQRLLLEIMARVQFRSVIDPFMGSGTTLFAAKELGRSATGIEIEERYCEIAAKRLSQEVLAFA